MQDIAIRKTKVLRVCYVELKNVISVLGALFMQSVKSNAACLA
jgi:hypothetical protein